MPLFSIVTAIENEEEETFIVSSNHNVKDIPGGNYVKDFTLEYVKSKNGDTQIGNGSFKKDDFIIYYTRVGEPPITLYAFTNKKYSSSLASECLETYRDLVIHECESLRMESLKKDLNRTIRGTSELLKTIEDVLFGAHSHAKSQ